VRWRNKADPDSWPISREFGKSVDWLLTEGEEMNQMSSFWEQGRDSFRNTGRGSRRLQSPHAAFE